MEPQKAVGIALLVLAALVAWSMRPRLLRLIGCFLRLLLFALLLACGLFFLLR